MYIRASSMATFSEKAAWKGRLPVFLEGLHAALGAAAPVAAPDEVLGEIPADAVDLVVVERIHHRLDGAARVVGLAHVGIAAEQGLLGA